MIAYGVNIGFFDILQSGDLLFFFDFYEASERATSVGVGWDEFSYEDFNLKIKHF